MKTNGLQIAAVEPSDFNDWVDFSLALFPKTSRQEIEAGLQHSAHSSSSLTFMARIYERNVGFATMSLRTDYVEGTSTSPVGYLEAIYVDPEYRNRGVARALYEYGEKWCRDLGCIEMGSDTWHWNKEAHAFHERLGFKKEDILVHFYKKITP